jgi:type II restriction enzyme
LLSYSHLAVLLAFSHQAGPAAAQDLLRVALRSVEVMIPDKGAVAYWAALNGSFLDTDDRVRRLWETEKRASLEAIAIAKDEGLTFLARQREAILSLTHEEALRLLIAERRIERRMNIITAVKDNGLMDIA